MDKKWLIKFWPRVALSIGRHILHAGDTHYRDFASSQSLSKNLLILIKNILVDLELKVEYKGSYSPMEQHVLESNGKPLIQQVASKSHFQI